MGVLDWFRKSEAGGGAANPKYVATASWNEDRGDGSVEVHGQRTVAALPTGQNLASGAAPSAASYGEVATSATAVQVLAGNANRIGFRIKVQSGTSYIGFDNAVDDTNGDELFPKDVISQYGDGCYQGPLWVARASGTGEVRVWEW